MSTEPTERFMFKSAAFLLLRDGDRVLMYKRISVHENGNYGLISGHLDGNETAQAGIIREAQEEIGITLQLEDLQVVHVMHYKTERDEYFTPYILAKKWKGEIQNLEPDRCADLAWFDKNSLPENTIRYVKQALDYIERGIFYSNFGF